MTPPVVLLYRSRRNSKWHAANPDLPAETVCGLPLPAGGHRDTTQVNPRTLYGRCFA